MRAQTPNVLHRSTCALHCDVCRSSQRRHVSYYLHISKEFSISLRYRYTGYEDGRLSKHTFLQHEEGFDPFTGQKGWKRLKKALSQDRRWSGVATPSYSPDGLYVVALVSFHVHAISVLHALNANQTGHGGKL